MCRSINKASKDERVDDEIPEACLGAASFGIRNFGLTLRTVLILGGELILGAGLDDRRDVCSDKD